MNMTVKDVKERIEDLQLIYNNAVKIQNCCLKNEDVGDCIKELEEKATLNTTLHHFASITASYISDEIRRLEKAIDNAAIKID